MEKQVFLGGASGTTTWRREIAIPLLERAGITYFNPQLGVGEWTPACEAAEMEAKASADVLLYVVGDETRGVATMAEMAHGLGSRRRVALAVKDIGPESSIDGVVPGKAERDDLNRGRIFIRTMAREAGTPVFADVEGAVLHAIALIQEMGSGLTAERVGGVLADVQFGGGRFEVEATEGGFLMELVSEETDAATERPEVFRGRKWHIASRASRSDIVRTAFKAVAAWQEHEAREKFLYRGVPVFGPHSDVDVLADLIDASPKASR
jgi:hypothetical protein